MIYHLTVSDIRAQKRKIMSTVSKAIDFYDHLDQLELDILGLKPLPQRKIKHKNPTCLCSMKNGRLVR